eukprot:COSAG01_NODE_3648_length_5827_cov_4.766934_4_plen_81_part_00
MKVPPYKFGGTFIPPMYDSQSVLLHLQIGTAFALSRMHAVIRILGPLKLQIADWQHHFSVLDKWSSVNRFSDFWCSSCMP